MIVGLHIYVAFRLTREYYYTLVINTPTSTNNLLTLDYRPYVYSFSLCSLYYYYIILSLLILTYRGNRILIVKDLILFLRNDTRILFLMFNVTGQ